MILLILAKDVNKKVIYQKILLENFDIEEKTTKQFIMIMAT